MGSIAVVRSAAGPAEGTAVERALRAAPHRGSEVDVLASGSVALGVSNDPALRDAWATAAGGRAAVVTGSLDNLAEVEAALGLTVPDVPAGGAIEPA